MHMLRTIYLNQEFLQIPIPVLVGLGAVIITSGIIIILHRLSNTRIDRKDKDEKVPNTVSNEECPGIEAEFDEINLHLQDDLKSCIAQKVDTVRTNILIKQKELDEKIAKSNSDKDEELAIVKSKYLAEKEEIEEKYIKEINKVRNIFMSEIYDMKETIQSMKIVLSSSDVDEEIVEKTKSELECPVCMEEMRPPKRIWQCSDGHPLCENCRKKPEMNNCPTCRKYLVGRSTIAEKLARALYPPELEEEEKEGEDQERKPKKIKLF